jgi:hypothetical protein
MIDLVPVIKGTPGSLLDKSLSARFISRLTRTPQWRQPRH